MTPPRRANRRIANLLIPITPWMLSRRTFLPRPGATASIRILPPPPPEYRPRASLPTSNSYHSTAPTFLISTASRSDAPLDRSVARSTSTITHLSREGRILDAREVFDRISNKDVVSWTAIISAYVRCGRIREARLLFDHPSALKNVITWTAMLSGYVRNKQLREAEELFLSMPDKNVVSWNTMMSAYAENGSVGKAYELFEVMPQRNVVSWNTILTALAQSGRVSEALVIFDRMTERDVISWTAMVAGLSQNGRVDDAREIFDKMPEKNVVSWNAMISGYAQNMRIDEALDLFQEMPVRDVPSWNTMITGLIQNGNISRARELFDEMKARNVVTWTSLITGYVQDGQGEEGMRIFKQMQKDGIRPNQGTFVSVLAGVSYLAGLGEGLQIHQVITKTIFQFSPFVDSALISMYAKCGEIATARKTFDNTKQRDLVTWNSMVAAYAHHGWATEAICLLAEMQRIGIKPDGATYVGLLSACSHSGLVEEGLKLFDALLNDGSIDVREDHYACLVDLCGRAGRLEEAARFIDRHKVSSSSAYVWGALLAGCNVHRNVKVGKLAAKRLLKAEPGNAGTYMLLSNIYASSGRYKEAVKVREKMKDKGLKKQPGCSWIEVENMVHVFIVRDKSHQQCEIIFKLLLDLHYEMKMVGYVPNNELSFVSELEDLMDS